jgi:serine-type D-Ala-D-Ala carboxypeptidase (penicillin-binding protein 5/6)
MARAATLAAISLVVGLGGVGAVPGLVPDGIASASGYTIGGAALAARGTLVRGAHGVPTLPRTTATAFLVADATTGAILAARDAHGRLAPASTLKVLTAVTMLPRLNPAATIRGSARAAGIEGTRVGIVQGVTYSVNSLFTAMLMMSGNDAAVAIADAGGGVNTTIARMNAKATQLRAFDTVAHTASGLDAPGQTSSAYDLALIFRAGLAMPRFRHYLSMSSASFPLPGGTSYRIYTHDRLLGSYAGMIGGKNGYTIAAQASFVGAARRAGHTIIVVVMRDVPNFWPETAALLNWGFAADGHVRPVGYLVAPRR